MAKNKIIRVPSDIFPPGVCELTVRYRRAVNRRVKITCAADVVEFAREHFYDQEEIETREKLMVVYLDRAGKVFCWQCLSEGGLTGTVADPRLIFRTALLVAAVSLIIFHNHPSGNCEMSISDLELTKRLCEAGKTLEIKVLDHIIITTSEHFSFAEAGHI